MFVRDDLEILGKVVKERVVRTGDKQCENKLIVSVMRNSVLS